MTFPELSVVRRENNDLSRLVSGQWRMTDWIFKIIGTKDDNFFGYNIIAD